MLPRTAVLVAAALLAAPVLALTLAPPAAPGALDDGAAPAPDGRRGGAERRDLGEGLEGMLQQSLPLGEPLAAEDAPPLPEEPGVALAFAPRIEVDPSRTGAEPGIDVAPNGCIFIHAIGDKSLWRRCPLDTIFHRASVPGFVISGLDAEVAIDPNGVVFFSDLWLGSASLLASRNGGLTWTINNPVSLLPPVDDRQWLATLGPGEVALVTNQIPGGITFTRCALPPAVLNAPVACAPTALVAPAAARFCVCPPGQPAVSADGQHVVIPYFAIRNLNPDPPPPIETDLVIEAAVSHDRGLTWTTETVARSTGEPGIFPVAAFDTAGNAYVTWAGQRSAAQGWEVWLARSLDEGATWDAATFRVSAGGTNVMPWIAAAGPGQVALAWYHSDQARHPESVTADWFLDFASSANMDQPAPTVARARAAPEPLHTGDLSISGLQGDADRDLLDFLQVALDAQGMAHIAFADDKVHAHDGHAHVHYVRQTS